MADTKIEWCEKVWNPITGCAKISAGCKHCYAERMANRKLPKGGFVDRAFTDVRFHPERLDQPSRWKKPRRIFVNSMSDLFHEQVDGKIINAIWMEMFNNRHHTYQVLTKRPERLLQWTERAAASKAWPIGDIWPEWIWLGVSVEDQATADARIPLLLQVPAAVHIVSYEPALGPVDFTGSEWWDHRYEYGFYPNEIARRPIDWIIAGGESGPNARPAHPDWFRSVRDQCQEAGVPFFMKQMSGRKPIPDDLMIREFPEGGLHDPQ